MGQPVIVSAARTPIGKHGGALSREHPARLLGHVQRHVLERGGVDPSSVGQVIGGCVTQVGEQGFNVTRIAWLSAGLPHEVGALTIDCQCGASQHANHLVSSLIASGAIDTGIACGVEAMSRVAMGSNTRNGPGHPKPDDFGYDMPDQFVAAERIAAKHGLTRHELDAFGCSSHQKALRAAAECRFVREIVPVEVPEDEGGDRPCTISVARDEGPRRTTAERIAGLKPVVPNGLHTAATICQMSDGAAAVLWMDERRARALGLPPRARVVAQALVGSDPYYHIDGPIDATAAVLKQAKMSVRDIDLFEINEAFASVVLAWQRVYGVDLAQVNVNGGAIAIGHPMGATGSRLIATAVYEMERTGQSTALVSMCCGGAMATATILERI
ncbi:MAG: steroid 3-ketoacyl-CoA thiolase [Vicinamibacterales bacterium]